MRSVVNIAVGWLNIYGLDGGLVGRRLTATILLPAGLPVAVFGHFLAVDGVTTCHGLWRGRDIVGWWWCGGKNW